MESMFGKDFRNLFDKKEIAALAMAFLVVTLLSPSAAGIACCNSTNITRF
jgi:hypothetical protein